MTLEVDQYGSISILSAEGDLDAVASVATALSGRGFPDKLELYIEDHQMPQTLSEQMLFERFVAKYQNNLSKIDKFLDTL